MNRVWGNCASSLRAITVAALLLILPADIAAQRGQAPPPAKAAAPVDLTGYWVSVISEDWMYRMITPKKGDFGMDDGSDRSAVPMTADARRLALAWDPAKDEAEGNQCKWYGAGNIMRVPGRLHINWADDTTLRIETDSGMQTRLFHFGGPPPRGRESTWQGYSVAEWEYAGGRRGQVPGNLKVVTTGMRPGYLRRNGVPYSGNAVVTEHFHRTMEPNGDSWLIVSTLVEDPQYLTEPFIVSTNFKKVPDASGWNPEPCSAK